jgi:hypothetical protein
MSIRLRYRIEVALSSTSAEERDLANPKWEVVTDTQAEGGSARTFLAAGANNVQLNMPTLDKIRFLAIRTTSRDPTLFPSEIRIIRNVVSSEPISIVPVGDIREGHLLFSTDNLNILYATNMGTTNMDVTVIAAGDY